MKVIEHIGDLLDVESLQRIQDDFAKSMALAFITVDYKGRPITNPSNFTDFCTKGRTNVAFREMCFQCDAHGGLHSAITGQPYIYRCHADLVDFAVPLILAGSYVGAVMGGQVKLQQEEVNQLEYLVPRQMDWKNDPELVEAHDKIKIAEYSKVEASVTLLRNMIQFLLEEEYKKRQEQTQEKSRSPKTGNGESSLVEPHTVIASTYQAESEHFFYMLNVAAKLAYLEKAPRTESVVCDFADMLRYALHNSNSRLVMLGEELDYVERLLRTHKAQRGDRFSYEINVTEKYRTVACPYMMLQPLVENALKYAVDTRQEGVRITITCKTDDDDLLLYITDNGMGIGAETIDAILDTEGYRGNYEERMNLYNMNRKLKGYYGRRHGLVIRSNQDKLEGTEICIRLPLSSMGLME